MNKENKIVPQLRFPEFVNEGEWEEKKLGECLLRNPEYGINAPAVPYSNKLPTYIRITDISEEGHFLSHGKVSVDRDITESNYLIKGDIVLARTGASVGKSYKYKEKDGRLVFAGFLIRISPNINKLNSELLFQCLSTPQYWKWVSFISVRSGQPGINGTEYSSMPIIIPPTLTEQQKIASCLSSLDELIAAESQKLEALKDHKKGLMQNLFPQEGETVPKHRFKEFEKQGEWELPKLEDKMDIFRGASPRPQGDPKYYGGKVPRLMIEDVTRDGKYSTPKIDSLTEEGATKSRFLKKGSVVLSCSGTRVAIPGILAVDACIHDGWLGFKNLKEVDTEFLYYHFCNLHEKIQGDALAGGVFNNLTTTILKEMKLGFPRLKEQQKIASCLSSLDSLITAQTEKIEQLKLHKKGLMQGLFPKIND